MGEKSAKNRILEYRRGAQVMENIIAHAAKSGVRYLDIIWVFQGKLASSPY